MKGQISIILGISLGIIGAGLLVVAWGDCLKEGIDFMERFVSPVLKPVAEVFGLDQGDLFRSPDGSCRKWWGDSMWVVSMVFLAFGAGVFLSGSYKLLKRSSKYFR